MAESEDAPEIALHKERMGEPPRRAEGQRIVDDVADHRAGAARLEV